MSETAAELWNEMVTVGLLGTDRRDPPELPSGPLADLVDDAVRPTPSARLLTAVAAMVVARRCGSRPQAPQAPLMGPARDDRPLLPVVAARRWREIVAHWPILEPEWLAASTAAGWRPPPDVLVALLDRHRRSAAVAAAVVRFGGPSAPWLIEHVPDLGPLPNRRPDGSDRPDDRVLPVPGELDPLLDGSATLLATALVEGLGDGTFKWSHRAVLLNAVARAPRRSLPTVIEALGSARGMVEPDGGAREHPVAPRSLWESLLELAVIRRDMLDELEPAP